MTKETKENTQVSETKTDEGAYLIKEGAEQTSEKKEPKKVSLIKNGVLQPLAKAYIQFKQNQR